mgnify:CR=1 FL=1|jgi:hypothetical protein
MSIRDDSYPFLVFLNSDIPFKWNNGFMYSLLLESTFLRINSRGLQHSQIPLNIRKEKWYNAECKPTLNALCEFKKNDTTMLMFPNTVVDIPDNFKLLEPETHAFLQGFPGQNYSPCTHKYSNRIIDPEDLRYEVSLCDVLNANMDFVLDLKNNMIYWKQEKTPIFLYILYSILAIYLISLMTNNIINILTIKQASEETTETNRPSTHLQWFETLKKYSYLIFLSSSLIFLLVFAFLEILYRGTLITLQDEIIVYFLTVYCLVQFTHHYLLKFLQSSQIEDNETAKEESKRLIDGDSTPKKSKTNLDERDKSFSLLVAFLLLLIMLVYKTFDTPYLTLMTTLFLIRSWQKLFSLQTQHQKDSQKLVQNFLIFSTLVDFFIAINLILLVYSSMRSGSHLVASMRAYLHIFSIVFTSLVVALGMHKII